ncbi:MAG: NUDIX domain-containing protein [Candidatus Pacebacteria bacterium]|nr:NUDIX domain-containing protein [Candidatus Paceibacterota bacterium]
MPVEKSAGAIVFRKEEGKTYYLLLHYPSISHRAKKEYWDLPKGHIEKGEELEDTVKREVEEETGLKDIEFMREFKETIRYFFRFEGKNILKFVTFYLVRTQNKDVKISGEHLDFLWLPYEEALKKLTFKNAKEILQKSNEFLSKKGI